jgi:HEAT repeat protein
VKLLQEAKVEVEDGSLLTFLHNRTPSDEDLLHPERLVQDLGSASFEQRQQASRNLAKVGVRALAALREAEAGADREKARRAKECIAQIDRETRQPFALAAIRILLRTKPAGTLEALLRYLPCAADEETEEALWYGLERLGMQDGPVDRVIVAALTDRVPARRAFAACVLGRGGNDERRGAVGKLLRDPDPEVRLRAAQGLLAGKDKASVATLIGLLEGTSIEVAWQAEELLHWVAGDDAPEVRVGTGMPQLRQACRAAWEEWRRGHEAKLDLAELDKQPRRPGLLLVCEDEGAQDGDRVWLCGCDGQTRWEIRNAGRPRDAHLLAGGRALIAETLSKLLRSGDNVRVMETPREDFRVTKRDITGKILWERPLPAPPDACQPLPSGNALIVFGTGDGVSAVETNGRGEEVCRRTFRTDDRSLPQYRGLVRHGRILRAMSRGVSLDLVTEFDFSSGREWQTMRREGWEITPGWLEALPGGGYLAPGGHLPYLLPFSSSARVYELDFTGQILWSCSAQTPSHASPLPNGNILVSCYGPKQDIYCACLRETTHKGKVVWEAFTEGLPTCARVCLPLVRFGFDAPRAPDLDLSDSVGYRIQDLKSKHALTRQRSAEILGRVRRADPDVLSALADALDDHDESVRHTASEAITAVAPVPYLMKLCKDKHPNVRVGALAALDFHVESNEQAVTIFVDAMKDEVPLVRRTALCTLGGLIARDRTHSRAKALLPTVIAALKDQDRDMRPGQVSVAELAIVIISRLGPEAKEATPALMAALQSQDFFMRAEAMSALGAIGPGAKAAVPLIIAALRAKDAPDQQRRKATRAAGVWALGQIQPDAADAVPVLLQALGKGEDDEVRKSAAAALGNIGPPAQTAIPSLEEALHDSNKDIAVAAADALKKIRR